MKKWEVAVTMIISALLYIYFMLICFYTSSVILYVEALKASRNMDYTLLGAAVDCDRRCLILEVK